MNREQVIAYIADYLWKSGIGSKGGGLTAATAIVDNLIAAGVLRVTE